MRWYSDSRRHMVWWSWQKNVSKKKTSRTQRKPFYSLGAPQPTPANCCLYSRVRASYLICIWEVAGKLQSWFRAISWSVYLGRKLLPGWLGASCILVGILVEKFAPWVRWPSVAWYEGARVQQSLSTASEREPWIVTKTASFQDNGMMVRCRRRCPGRFRSRIDLAQQLRVRES